MIAFILLFIGLLLIFIEFFLPGGILAVLGGLFVVAALVFFALKTISLLFFFLFFLLTAALVFIVIRFALKRMRGTKSIYLNHDQSGYSASSFERELIGKEGRAISDLKPSGHIVVEGRSFQAVSRSGYILKDTRVAVIGGEGGHLIVKELPKE